MTLSCVIRVAGSAPVCNFEILQAWQKIMGYIVLIATSVRSNLKKHVISCLRQAQDTITWRNSVSPSDQMLKDGGEVESNQNSANSCQAKKFIRDVLLTSAELTSGSRRGPTSHYFELIIFIGQLFWRLVLENLTTSHNYSSSSDVAFATHHTVGDIIRR